MGTLPRESKLAGLAQRLVLEHHTPACTLVNSRNEIRYLCGPTHDYLRPPTGVPTQDLLAWAHRDLRSKLRAALDTAAREGRSVTETAVRVQRGEECHTVDITVTPITVPQRPRACCWWPSRIGPGRQRPGPWPRGRQRRRGARTAGWSSS